MRPNKFIKFARVARPTGKSLRASPAVYELHYALSTVRREIIAYGI